MHSYGDSLATPPYSKTTSEIEAFAVGTRLHDGLLQSGTQPHAILAMVSAETAARRLYRRQGWQPLIDSLKVPALARPYCVLGKHL